jgi:hypothetical protein
VKYVALLTNTADDIARWHTLTPAEARAEREREIPKWNALMGELGAAGILLDGAELDDPATAKTVRVREGETVVTDGPYAETKEQVGGFFLLECDDLDHAISVAARIPVAERGSVELRPIVER